jgi:hypothetical protein
MAFLGERGGCTAPRSMMRVDGGGQRAVCGIAWAAQSLSTSKVPAYWTHTVTCHLNFYLNPLPSSLRFALFQLELPT